MARAATAVRRPRGTIFQPERPPHATDARMEDQEEGNGDDDSDNSLMDDDNVEADGDN